MVELPRSAAIRKWRNSTRRGATSYLPEIIQLSALTTGATSPTVRTAEYF